jgi:leucyl-tRNA synthetase
VAAGRRRGRVTDDFDRWGYNTAVAACMEYVNDLYKYVQAEDGPRRETLDEAVDALLLVLAPMAPHISAELWERRHGAGAHVHEQPWPTSDPELAKAETVTMIVQVNGKVRDRIDVDASIDEVEMEKVALASSRVQEHLAGRTPRNVIIVRPKLVNLVG